MFRNKYCPNHKIAWLLVALWSATAFQPSHAADSLTQPAEVPPSFAPNSVVPPDPDTDRALFAQADVPGQAAASDTAQSSQPAAVSPAAPAPDSTATKSENVTVNLINRLVERGILTKQDSGDLIKQAEEDASDARIEAQRNALQAAQAAVAQAAPPPPSDDSVRVTYIPEIVKAQMRDQIKQEVMDQAREENWAAPRTMPEWAPRFRFTGDVRIRYEGDYYPAGNDNSGTFANFNAINTGSPYDTSISNTTFYPTYNVDKNRTRFRLRARFGAEVDLGDGFTSGIRFGSGDNSSPVTENQSLGSANSGQGGDFSKYALWIDRAFIKYELAGQPDQDRGLAVTLGRFDNPFFTTSTIVWASDLGFDGAALQAHYKVADGFTPFLNAGAFPVFNTDFNYSTTQAAKYSSNDKYLYAGQFGANWKINEDLNLKAAAAYYYFQNVEGRVSSSFIPTSASDQGNTDDSRPSFAQNGNTYIALRTIDNSTSANNYGSNYQYQYYGLATPFHELNVNAKLDYSHFDPVHVIVAGEFVKNTAFSRSAILANGPTQQSGPVNNKGTDGTYNGGDAAWIVSLKVGAPALEKLWDWNAGVDYRYVESDAVVDGFADSDFGAPLSGTNLRGYSLFGNLALSQRVWLGVRWLSATSITGSPYRNDTVQVDINAKF